MSGSSARRALRRSSASTASRRGAGTSRRSRRSSLRRTAWLAPDLLGHGDSEREPPWRIADHLAHLAAALDGDERIWLGHSFGGRLAFEWAASRPGAVDRLVLLDPAILVPPPVALWAAENARMRSAATRASRRRSTGATRRASSTARRGRSSRTSSGTTSSRSPTAGATATRRRPSSRRTARWPRARHRSRRSASRPSSCSASSRTCRTTICSTPTERRSATCSRSSRCPGGHSVLWDALDETAAAISRFLARPSHTAVDSRP